MQSATVNSHPLGRTLVVNVEIINNRIDSNLFQEILCLHKIVPFSAL